MRGAGVAGDIMSGAGGALVASGVDEVVEGLDATAVLLADEARRDPGNLVLLAALTEVLNQRKATIQMVSKVMDAADEAAMAIVRNIG